MWLIMKVGEEAVEMEGTIGVCQTRWDTTTVLADISYHTVILWFYYNDATTPWLASRDDPTVIVIYTVSKRLVSFISADSSF